MDLVIIASLYIATFSGLLFFNFRWIVKELRSICKDESGYIKLLQLVFISVVLVCFLLLLAYSLIVPESISKLDVFLTVIVGFMGTIIGTFFSERSMEGIMQDRDLKREKIIEKKIKIEQYKEIINKLLAE